MILKSIMKEAWPETVVLLFSDRKSRKQQFFGGSGTRVQKAGERSNGSRGTSGRTPHCDF